MCGFAGITFQDAEYLKNISHPVRIRAIDAEYFFESPQVSLYHAHLKISDLDKDTSQPYQNDSCIVSFVGEIYNKKELCDLISISQEISEIKLLAKLYKQLGEDGMKYINGEFALCIFDTLSNTLYLFRDRYGSKPLYYGEKDANLIFSTELASFIKEDTTLSKENLYNHMIFGFGISPHTLLQGVYSLTPGEFLKFQDGKINIQSYAKYKYFGQEKSFLPALEQAVIRRLPRHQKQIFLSYSGGLDSSIIACFLQKHFHGEVIAYSFLRKENQEDIKIASENAKLLNMKHLIIDTEQIHLDYDISVHEGLVHLPNLYKILRTEYPEYSDIRVEFGGDGKEELFLINTNFNLKKIHKNIEQLDKKIPPYSITPDFLNSSMLDYNLQMIDKMSLRYGIERRMPFLDYELIFYKTYPQYQSDIVQYITKKGMKIPSQKYGYSDGIGFHYHKDSMPQRAKKLLQLLKK